MCWINLTPVSRARARSELTKRPARRPSAYPIILSMPSRPLAGWWQPMTAPVRRPAWRFTPGATHQRSFAHAGSTCACRRGDAAALRTAIHSRNAPHCVRRLRGLPRLEAPTGHPVVKIYETRVARVCSHSTTERAKYLVVGATAMQRWGTSRATRDIDILIDPSVANARRALRAMSKLGFGLAAEHLAEHLKPCVLAVNFGRQAPTD